MIKPFGISVTLLLSIVVFGCRKSPIHSASNGLWNPVELKANTLGDAVRLHPTEFELYSLDADRLKDILMTAGYSIEDGVVVLLPNPDNELVEFTIWKGSSVSEELIKKYPGLQPYEGHSTASPSHSLRLENGSKGLQVMVMTGGESWFIAPFSREKALYMVFNKSALPRGERVFEETIEK